ncbi:MAG: hypothetical protein KF886_18815 [Candidatus Hydrogenedentes bacterium]|nr:hypothetical protein [Candidatus Hydrogenedentota bacterium]
MNSDNIGAHPRPEVLDADAVCAQCNTVNAEGTLLCKVCGNNLRDQRAIRLAADQVMDLEHTGRRRRTWASAGLFVVAIGVIVATLVNQDLIVSWLIQAPGGSETAAALWRGADSARFEAMTGDLSQTSISEELARESLENPRPFGSIEGNYALFQDGAFVGTALVEVDGDGIYFVALLDNGSEVRGRGAVQGNYFAAPLEYTGVRRRGYTTEARGVAMPRGNGVVDCIGDYLNSQISFVACQVSSF